MKEDERTKHNRKKINWDKHRGARIASLMEKMQMKRKRNEDVNVSIEWFGIYDIRYCLFEYFHSNLFALECSNVERRKIENDNDYGSSNVANCV